MSEVKPIIRWTGGKQQYYKEILTYFPELDSASNYFEPFAGGGSIFLNVKTQNKYISDINPHLINMYVQIRKNPAFISDQLIILKEKYLDNPDYYYILRNEFNSNILKYNLENAVLFIFLIQSNFNGIFRLNQKGEYNVPKGKTNPAIASKMELEVVKKALKKIKFKCCPYQTSLSKIRPNDLLYIDPPYPKLNWKNLWNLYTIKKFHKEQHEILNSKMNELTARNVKILISFPDIPFVRKTYSDWNINILETHKNELILTNFTK